MEAVLKELDGVVEDPELEHDRDFLTRRFGVLPGETVTRLEQTDLETLDRWNARLVKASSLDEVLGDRDE